jgi:NAD(P)-dependent dehydrogenase (short-subunit alcohol dehydrogenase family)
MRGLAGKRVLITGGASGIGAATAQRFIEEEARVFVLDRDATACETITRELTGLEGTLIADVSDVEAVTRAFTEMDQLCQGIDVLINNAGIFGEFATQAFGAIDFDQFDTFMRTNALGPLKMCEAFVPHVKASQAGKMVSITSQAGSFGLDSGGLPGMYFYKSSKAAQNMIMRNVANDVQAHGIVVCILSPGMVNTAGDDIPPERRFPGLIEPPESIEGMIGVIDRLTMEDTGGFIRYTGEPQPW